MPEPSFATERCEQLQRINKLSTHESVTSYIANLQTVTDNERRINYPEYEDSKIVNYYLYEKKVEQYFNKGGRKVEYTRTARVDKGDMVSSVVGQLMKNAENYLKHRSYVNNSVKVLPLIRESFKGHYIELDFLENLAFKPKIEPKQAHFSGKQFTLHCAIVEPEETKYQFHLSDDTTHDCSFVDEVLRDIFEKYDIRDETIIIKSDNAPSQYKNKDAFAYLQNLSDEYNVIIARIYGAAGHGKGLIDAMSSFGVKSIIRKDIVTHDVWFDSAEDISDYLKRRNNGRMEYTAINQETVNQKRRNVREGLKITGCMRMHLLIQGQREES